MFQTEPILWIQSFASEPLTRLLSVINLLGYSEFQIPFVIFVLFAVHFRHGFLLAQALLWNSLFTDLLKDLFALPRPADVDAAVRLLPENIPNPGPFDGRDAQGFFSGLPADVIQHYRSLPGHSFGFPSGHVSSTLTLAGGAYVLFRQVYLAWIAAAFTLLMALTRMYFGRHFLADVLGGAIVAVGVLSVLAFMFAGPQRIQGLAQTSWSRWISFAGFPLATLLFPGVEAETVARLLGLNAAFVLITRQGMLTQSAGIGRRLACAVVGFAVYFVADVAIGAAAETAFGERDVVEACAEFATVFASLSLATLINRRLGLFVGTSADLH